MALADALIEEKYSDLKMLELQGNHIGPQGAQAIARALMSKNCFGLIFINLQWNL